MKDRREWVLEVRGMACEHCVSSVTHALDGVRGTESVDVTLDPPRAVVTGRGLDQAMLVRAIERAGFSAEPPSVPFFGPGGTRGPLGEGSSKPDLIVIGGGSAGFAAAIRAQELGASVVMVNEGMIGGTCVNVGCVPSKTLIRAAEAHHRATRHAFEGIEGSSRVTDFSAVIRQKAELVESLRQAKYEDVLDAYEGVSLVAGRAVLEGSDSVRVGDRMLRADRIVVATGSRPRFPEIPGLAEGEPLTSTSAFELDRLPESLIVLGGRYIALECAQMFARFGSRVTILQRSDHILPAEDDDLTDALAAFLREEGVRVETGVRIGSVERAGNGVVVRAEVAGESEIFKAERILAATGRRPLTAGMALRRGGVELGMDGRILVNDHLRSSTPGIYAAGDVVGEPAFVYTAAYEGSLAAENALSGDVRQRDYTALPWVVFTDPQMAGVGLSEKGAAESGIDVDVATLPLSHVPRALAARDTRGFIKLLRMRGTDELVGARILAPEGGEQVMEVALAIRHGIGVADLAATFHPYLTQAEGVKLCAQTFGKDVSKLSCCSA